MSGCLGFKGIFKWDSISRESNKQQKPLRPRLIWGFQTHTISRERTNLETAKISTLPKFNIDLEKW